MRELFQDLKMQVFELHNHAWVVQLELNHASLKPLVCRQVLGEFGG